MNCKREDSLSYIIRNAENKDVPALLELFPQVTSRPNSAGALVPDLPEAMDIWEKFSKNPNIYVLVAVDTRSDEVVGTTTLIIVPNFTYGGRSWSVIENVVVRPAHRRQKIGQMLLAEAFEIAKSYHCYKTQWISGSKPEQLEFYRSMGSKTEGYVAHRVYFWP